jgi:hypothetical protein
MGRLELDEFQIFYFADLLYTTCPGIARAELFTGLRKKPWVGICIPAPRKFVLIRIA